MFSKRRMMFAVLTVVCCGAAIAEPDPNAYADEGVAQHPEQLQVAKNAGLVYNENVYEISREASKLAFHVDSPIGDVWASFEEFEGSFVMQNSGVQGNSLSIDIDASSLDSDTCLVGAMLRGEDFFDAKNFPFLHFVGSSFEWISDRQAVLKGHLTIKNVTRQIAFYIELTDADIYQGEITMKATTTIKRSEFGIKSLLPSVSDNVNLYINIEAQKKSTAISML